MMQGGAKRCSCGQTPCRPYNDPSLQRHVERLIAELGINVKVTTPDGSWLVPRHFIALHGLKARELPTLGFEGAS